MRKQSTGATICFPSSRPGVKIPLLTRSLPPESTWSFMPAPSSRLLQHRRVLHDRRLHLLGGNEIRAALDEVVGAGDVPVIAFLVDGREVLGVVPAFPVDLRPALGIPVVAER